MARLSFPPHVAPPGPPRLVPQVRSRWPSLHSPLMSVCVCGGERYPGHAKRTCATRRRAPVRGEHKPGHVKRTCGTRKGGNREGETRAWLRQTHQGPIPGHWCMLRLYCAVLTPPRHLLAIRNAIAFCFPSLSVAPCIVSPDRA